MRLEEQQVIEAPVVVEDAISKPPAAVKEDVVTVIEKIKVKADAKPVETEEVSPALVMAQTKADVSVAQHA